jgi:hypothetical protein
MSYQAIPFSHHQQELESHDPRCTSLHSATLPILVLWLLTTTPLRKHRLPGFPFERMHSLYLHELVEVCAIFSLEGFNFVMVPLFQAASKAGFAVGWIQYRNVNAGIKQCASKNADGFCFKEDEVLAPIFSAEHPLVIGPLRPRAGVAEVHSYLHPI